MGVNELENYKYMYIYMLLNNNIIIIDGEELSPSSFRGGKANVRGHTDRQTLTFRSL